MNRYRCLGSINGVNSQDLHSEVLSLIPNAKGRPRIFGYDIEFDCEEFDFYINTYDEKEYKIDISSIDKNDFFSLLGSLKEILLKLEGIFDLVYFIEDEDGEQISEDFIYFNSENLI